MSIAALKIESLILKIQIRWLVIFAAALRLASFLLLGDRQFPDSLIYVQSGVELFQKGQIQSDFYMPLYPAITYLAGGRFGSVMFDVLVSAVLVLIAAKLSFSIFKDEVTAKICAVIVALYPFFIYYSTAILTETLYLTLLALSFYLFYSNRPVLGAFIWILNLLVKPVGELLTIPLLIAYAIAQKWTFLKFLKNLGITAGLYLALLAPWWAHNYMKYNQFVRLTLADGVVLYSGNNPMNKSGGGIMYKKGEYQSNVDVDLTVFDHIENPVERNNEMKRAAVEYIINDPIHFLSMAAKKFIRFWRLWPYAEDYGGLKYVVISLVSYGVLLFLCIWQLFRLRREDLIRLSPVLLFAAYLTAVHMVTIGSIRYRLPVEIFIIVIASQQLRGWIGRERPVSA